MSDSLTIQHGHAVTFDYTLKGDDGEVIDTSDGRGPMAYLHGFGNIVPGLEKQLEGKTVGTELTAVVAPGEGYGERDDDAFQAVPRTAFPPEMDVQVGMPVQAQGPEGQPMLLWIDNVGADEVVVTSNHPLAGKTLHFDVKVTGIRAASDEEKAHGHVHGPGGHHH